MFWLRNKNIIFQYALLSGGLVLFVTNLCNLHFWQFNITSSLMQHLSMKQHVEQIKQFSKLYKVSYETFATSDKVNKTFIQSTIIITESSWILQKHVLYAEVILM